MTLLDTNVPIGAFDPDSPHGQWARQTIADAVAIDGAAIDAVSLADFIEPDLRVPDAPPDATPCAGPCDALLVWSAGG